MCTALNGFGTEIYALQRQQTRILTCKKHPTWETHSETADSQSDSLTFLFSRKATVPFLRSLTVFNGSWIKMFDFLVRCIHTTRDSRRWIQHQKDPLYKVFSLPLIFVFRFDLSLTAFLPSCCSHGSRRWGRYAGLCSCWGRGNLYYPRRTDRKILTSHGFISWSRCRRAKAPREQLSYSTFQLIITTRLIGSKREQDTQMER